MTDEQLVSVVIPLYNGREYIRESIKSADEQNYENLEIIVVDDNSSDESTQIVENTSTESRLTLVKHERNRGIAETRNTGVKEAEGEFIAILDQDDIWKPTKVSKQVSYMNSNPETGIVFSGIIHIDQENEPLKTQRFERDINSLSTKELATFIYTGYPNSGIPLTSELIRREVYEEVGYYNPNFYGTNDTEFLFRLIDRYDAGVITEPLMFKRHHLDNASNDRDEILRDKKNLTEWAPKHYPFLEVHKPKRENFFHVYEAGDDFLCGRYSDWLSKYSSILIDKPHLTVKNTIELAWEYIKHYKSFKI